MNWFLQHIPGFVDIEEAPQQNSMNSQEAIQSNRAFLSTEPTEVEMIAQGLLDPWHWLEGTDLPAWLHDNSDADLEMQDGGGVKRFRLLNGWLYVVGDGSIPEGIKGAKAGEWEYKCRAGFTQIAGFDLCLDFYRDSLSNSRGKVDIVAVRRIVPEKQSDGQLYTAHSAKKAESALIKEVESLKQKLTREAYERHMSLFPVKEPFRPLGESGIDEAAAMAVKDHKI